MFPQNDRFHKHSMNWIFYFTYKKHDFFVFKLKLNVDYDDPSRKINSHLSVFFIKFIAQIHSEINKIQQILAKGKSISIYHEGGVPI